VTDGPLALSRAASTSAKVMALVLMVVYVPFAKSIVPCQPLKNRRNRSPFVNRD
jgi:hypothetical protein